MSAILFVLAVLFSAIAFLLGFGIVSGAHVIGWLALGAAFGWGGLLVGSVPGEWVRRG